MAKIPRNTEGLIEHIFRTMERQDEGELTPQHVIAVNKSVNAIVSVKRLEHEARRFIADPRNEHVLGKATVLQLVGPSDDDG